MATAEDQTREYTMVIALECPWCEGVLLADESELDEGPRCNGCGVRFDFASDEAAELSDRLAKVA